MNPALTIGKQIAEPIHLHRGLPWKTALGIAGELLGKVQIPESQSRLSAYPHQFSGGMRQRAMIAMALACEPRLIIADEPTTALDVTVQAQILDLLKDLAQRMGTALILITHDLGVVARYADRVAVMYGGRLVETASAEALYRHPAHPYTRGLMASVPRIDGDTTRPLVPIDGQPPDLSSLGAGCAFLPRCKQAMEQCRGARPALRDVGEPTPAPASEQHLKACFLHELH
jgi:oligopeptide transport system ATP-binding protein